MNGAIYDYCMLFLRLYLANSKFYYRFRFQVWLQDTHNLHCETVMVSVKRNDLIRLKRRQ